MGREHHRRQRGADFARATSVARNVVALPSANSLNFKPSSWRGACSSQRSMEPQRAITKRQPALVPVLCRGCGRCIGSCNRDCIAAGTAIEPTTGLLPVVLDLEACNGCGLCIDACPELYGLDEQRAEPAAIEPAHAYLPAFSERPIPPHIPDERVALDAARPLVVKGTHASAIGALYAGCRHFFGYPITPSTEGAELMARLLPQLGGRFVQAVSEVAAVNMIYGCGGAGQRSMTFTSGPGMSLMLEGISYLIGAEIPGVFVDVMRGGPGLGNIAPEQSDIKLACRGLGHGNTHALVLAPATPQEMLDFTILAFDRAFHYRNPVIILCDGYLGQMTGRVELPRTLLKPGLPSWAVSGDAGHRGNLLCSILLDEHDLEAHNHRLDAKYRLISSREQRAELHATDDAEVLVVACNTPARMAKGAVGAVRRAGVRAGLFRPQTLWPFPIDALRPLVGRVRRLVVVEASSGGQLEDELRLALSHAGLAPPTIEHVRRAGGVLPQQAEIVEHILAGEERAR
jgi:pyruvate/2-oxoacid:ferredoxin oxidoreductase alpha subunit/NAD-dependent dihydropyrimidine dehydrogenase PreA subunit